MKPINLEINDGVLIHIWTGAMNKVMIANYDTQTLLSFDTLDDAVNGLWLSGHKQAAKQLNGVTKK